MHNDGELARERHLRLLHAGALGDAHGPTLEPRGALDRFGQDHMRGIVEREMRPERSVSPD